MRKKESLKNLTKNSRQKSEGPQFEEGEAATVRQIKREKVGKSFVSPRPLLVGRGGLALNSEEKSKRATRRPEQKEAKP